MKKLIIILLMVGVMGCETTGDPRQGGLFGWSEDKAVGRQGELKQTLQTEESQMAAGKAETARLEQEQRDKRAELARQDKRLTALDKELSQMKKKVAQMEAGNTQKQQEKKKLDADIDKLKREIQYLQTHNVGGSVEAKQRRIDALNKEMESLLQIINAL